MDFTVQKLERRIQEIREAIYRGVIEIPNFRFHEGECPGAERPDYDDRDWPDFSVGSTWGGYDVVAWFRTQVPISPQWMDHKLALRFLVGPRDGGGSTAETLLYVNGQILQAIDIWHEEAWVPPELVQAGKLSVALKAWSGLMDVPPRRCFRLAQLIWIDQAAERLYYLADTLVRAAQTLDENDLRRLTLVQVVDEALQRIDFGKPGSPRFYDSLGCAAGYLGEQVARLAECQELKPTVTGTGHAHIDMAWLWRLQHTREKAARTFATVLHLMRQYPEYRFLHSSPQLYQFLKSDYPELYGRVKERIASGEWEVIGGTWVEMDSNLTGGESLVRQFLLGKRFIREEFGVDTKVLFLPDCFGFSWALPQLIKKSGMEYFLTSKISWNETNRFPYDTFCWRGIDGSEVLAHFVTTPDGNRWWYSYNGQMRPEDARGLWDNYQQKAINDELLQLFGWGDGGGGPTKEMIETARVLKNLPGLPRVELGKTEPFFDRLKQRLAHRSNVPVWDGELYLEYHRGTYTSQAQNKRANRMAEVLYHNAEWLSALADALTGEHTYPASQLRAGWERILLNQFHDILPGSSIHEVYEDSQKDYQAIRRIGEEAVATAQATMLDRIPTDGDSLVVFNPLSWIRDSLVELPWSEWLAGKTLIGTDGQPSPVQVVDGDSGKSILLHADSVPPLGYRTYSLIPDGHRAEDPQGEIEISRDHVENCYYRIELNEQGQITSLFDKRCGREVLAPGARGNVFQAFEDKPIDFDAWDINIFYQDKLTEVTDLLDAAVEEAGPLRGTLRLRWRICDSLITQRLTVYAHSPRVDFRTKVDWHEQQVLLKVAFPVAIRATRATFDIAFGNIERPTHWNTSWDTARFEQVGHKWVDLSEGNYGVGLLNDCKYGHDVKDNVLRLTLIKSAIRPDPQADQGIHTFTYSLLPHAGDWRSGEVATEGYALNYLVLSGIIAGRQQGSLPARYCFAELDADHVILETVKRAEDGDAWIVRVYEYKQCRNGAVHLTFGQPLHEAVECNLIEEDEQPAAWEGHCLIFGINPYEIKTFKVWF